jgi:hypothetical protein
MDRTHLRWFTPETFSRAFEKCGFVVEKIGPSTPLSPKAKLVNLVTLKRFEHLFVSQISLRAHKKG